MAHAEYNSQQSPGGGIGIRGRLRACAFLGVLVRIQSGATKREAEQRLCLPLSREWCPLRCSQSELVQGGRIHETEAFEDYFEFDHLEAERDALLGSLKELA